MVKKRILDPVPVLDQALLLQALRDEGIKEVSSYLAAPARVTETSLICFGVLSGITPLIVDRSTKTSLHMCA